MVKVDSSTVTGTAPTTKTTGDITVNTGTTEVKQTAFTVTGALLGYQIHRKSTTSSGSYHYVYINNTKTYDSKIVWGGSQPGGQDDIYLDYQTWPGTTNNSIQTGCKNNDSNTKTTVYELLYDVLDNIDIPKTVFTHKCLPRELKTIGNKALGTLFGMHVDNTRYTGDEE